MSGRQIAWRIQGEARMPIEDAVEAAAAETPAERWIPHYHAQIMMIDFPKAAPPSAKFVVWVKRTIDGPRESLGVHWVPLYQAGQERTISFLDMVTASGTQLIEDIRARERLDDGPRKVDHGFDSALAEVMPDDGST